MSTHRRNESGKRETILLLEDEEGLRFAVRDFLEGEGFEVLAAETCAEALEILKDQDADLAILDYRLPDGTALDVMGGLKELDPAMPVVVVTAHATIDLAVQAVKEGADHFITKPVTFEALLVLVERTLEARRDRRVRQATQRSQVRAEVDPFQGTSRVIRDLALQARRIASTHSPVLLVGETGTGKTLLASWIHRNGARREESFVSVNCAALPAALLESELFGHEKGAFTGANAIKRGLIEVADRGTLFLDEIGDLDLTLQPKLLTSLEERRFRRVGAVRDQRVDIRLIACSNLDLAAEARKGRFRSDLYYRISTLPLRVPPLRERLEDVPLLARTILHQLCSDLGRPVPELTPDADTCLSAHPWPGNIRELRNVLERALLFVDGDRIDALSLKIHGRAPSCALTRDEDRFLLLEEVERDHINEALVRTSGHVGEAARLLGIPRSTLYQRLKKYGIERSRS
ncbi:MAG: sigma-54 dependent transcriptional regulator [Deltaproteobacteria bacterium]|nr:sigma-54 dependent transcriptional regulator [Deltaproteobacteria bacterium]